MAAGTHGYASKFIAKYNACYPSKATQGTWSSSRTIMEKRVNFISSCVTVGSKGKCCITNIPQGGYEPGKQYTLEAKGFTGSEQKLFGASGGSVVKSNLARNCQIGQKVGRWTKENEFSHIKWTAPPAGFGAVTLGLSCATSYSQVTTFEAVFDEAVPTEATAAPKPTTTLAPTTDTPPATTTPSVPCSESAQNSTLCNTGRAYDANKASAVCPGGTCTDAVCCLTLGKCDCHTCTNETTLTTEKLGHICAAEACSDAECCVAASKDTCATTCDQQSNFRYKRRKGNRANQHTHKDGMCDEIFGYNWYNVGQTCGKPGTTTSPKNAIKQWSKEYCGDQTFKWGRSSVIDHTEGMAYVQFSRQGAFGGQYGPTQKRGVLKKISLQTGETMAQLSGWGGENRWAPYIHGDHVYTVLSHYLYHQDFNGLIPQWVTQGGRQGHWLYKLDKATLAVVGQREVSCDFGLFTTKAGHAKCSGVSDFGKNDADNVKKYLGDVQSTTQLNGVLAASAMQDDARCGPGEARMILGISGYPYYVGFSDEPQNRALGLHNFHHTGKLACFCTGSLLPCWKDPYRNSFSVPNEHFSANTWATTGGASQKRDLMVGDAIPQNYLKAGNKYIGTLTTLDCGNMPTDTRKLLPKFITLTLSKQGFAAVSR